MQRLLSQFVPSSVCLNCDGCCRFKEADSDWRARMAKSEIDEAVSLAQDIFSQDLIDEKNTLKTVAKEGFHACTCLDCATSECRIYTQRPFECQLYPFVISREADVYRLCVHLSCPHIQETINSSSYQEYVVYLKKFFKQASAQEFVRSNAVVFNDYSSYSQELEFLFFIDGV